MKIETRSAAILFTTLCIGVVVGVLAQGALQNARQRPRPLRADGSPPPAGFAAHMEEVLQLRVEQQATVRPILKATADANQRVIDAAHRQLRGSLDSMGVMLAPLLDEAQRTRLADVATALPDPFRGGSSQGGPPRYEGAGGPPRGGPPRGGPPRDGPMGDRRPPPPR